MNLNAIENEKKMPYITSVERLAREEGKAEGKTEGRQVGVVLGQIQLLAKLVGTEIPSLAVLEEKSLLELESLLSELNTKFKSQS